MQVGHLAGEELDVGAADPGPFDVDDDLTGDRVRDRHLLHGSLPRPGEHEGPHRRRHGCMLAPASAIGFARPRCPSKRHERKAHDLGDRGDRADRIRRDPRACVAEGLPVRALVRDRAKAAGFPDGVEVVTGDLLDAGTRDLDGVDRALLISSADRRLVETQQTFIDAAKRAGVGHVVKLSGRGCRSEFGVPVRADARGGRAVPRRLRARVVGAAAEPVHAGVLPRGAVDPATAS